MSTSQIRVSYTEADINRSVAERRLKPGVYQGKIVSSKGDVDKNGNERIVLKVAPVDESGNTRRPTVVYLMRLPFATSPEVLSHFGLPMTKEDGSPFQSEIPNTGWDLYNYAKATRPEIALDMPMFDATTKKWIDANSDATYSTKTDVAKRKTELLGPVFDFFATTYSNLVNDGEAKDLVGDTFVFKLLPYKTGSDFPNVKILGAECPENEVLITDLSSSTETVDG